MLVFQNIKISVQRFSEVINCTWCLLRRYKSRLNCNFSFDRPAPPLPQLHLSEEIANEVTAFIRTRVNDLLSVSQDIALGKDSKLFLKVAAYLWLISIIGGLTDFLTLAYTSKFLSIM